MNNDDATLDSAGDAFGGAGSSSFGLWDRWLEYERGFRGEDYVDFVTPRPWIPVAAAVLYLVFVFVGPRLMKNCAPWKINGLVAAWSLSLSVFSWIGVTRTAPLLLVTLRDRGWFYTICEDPWHWYANGPPGLWISLFMLSKIPEMLDTLWLVLKKKPVIFLHWYHHVTVMLYCWHAGVMLIAPGLWYGSMNYFVHGIMYAYYAVAATGPLGTKIVRPFARFVTILQIAQMIVGVVITAAVWYHRNFSEGGCACDGTNNMFAIVMYGSYLALFVSFFFQAYVARGASSKVAAKRSR